MTHLDSDNFKKLKTDTTKTVEESVQRALLNIKNAIGETEYKKIYPSGSNPGKFYGTAKVHKVKPDDTDKLQKLPVRPIVSNIGTATHKTAQYLCRLLSPLGKSEYSLQSTKEFVQKVRRTKAPKGMKMISFDVVSLFTNVPLQRTIDIILRKVYKEKKIKTKIPMKNMKKLLLLCTQGVPFQFNGDMYTQIDGVMMGSPLGALFANIFMSELESKIIPNLGDKVMHWTRYVDDTFAFIKPDTEEEIQNVLNSFHKNINFTYERENENMIPFLDVSVQRFEDGKIETSVYRKDTNTDIYMNWNAHAPANWKIATLKCLVKRAFMISSKEEYLQKELEHLKRVFCEYNDYPERLVDNIVNNEKETQNLNKAEQLEDDNEPIDKSDNVTLCLPYAGEKGEQLVKKMKKNITQVLKKGNKDTKIRIVFNSKKLGSKFPVKDKTEAKHLHNVVYHADCPNKKCESDYTGQTRCRIERRTIQHNRTDKNSHLLQHAKQTRHRRVWLPDFKILGSGYKSDFKRRISESLFIKTLKPSLNVQQDAYRLSLFN